MPTTADESSPPLRKAAAVGRSRRSRHRTASPKSARNSSAYSASLEYRRSAPTSSDQYRDRVTPPAPTVRLCAAGRRITPR